MLSSMSPNLRELYLTNNTITSVAKGALDSASLGILHLDSNQLTEVPTYSLSGLPNLEELSMSHNSVDQVGPKAFQPISQSLRRLYLDRMGMEKVEYFPLLRFFFKNHNLAYQPLKLPRCLGMLSLVWVQG